MMKRIIVPLAAFAITATGVSAFTFNEAVLERLSVDLTTDQIEVLETATTLHEAGDYQGAKALLDEAGIDKRVLRELHRATHAWRHELHEVLETALETNDFAAFQAAVVDTPLGEHVSTEAEFAKLREAHALREAGEYEGARMIMEELGIPEHAGKRHGQHGGRSDREHHRVGGEW